MVKIATFCSLTKSTKNSLIIQVYLIGEKDFKNMRLFIGLI
jgi:hypothetical protein